MTTDSSIAEQIGRAYGIDDGATHKKHAESRDAMLAILVEHPDILKNPSPLGQHLIRGAAERCMNVGPFEKSIELYRVLVQASNEAGDYAKFSEVLVQCDHLEEAIAALKKAMELDSSYDTPANRETLEMFAA